MTVLLSLQMAVKLAVQMLLTRKCKCGILVSSKTVDSAINAVSSGLQGLSEAAFLHFILL